MAAFDRLSVAQVVGIEKAAKGNNSLEKTEAQWSELGHRIRAEQDSRMNQIVDVVSHVSQCSYSCLVPPIVTLGSARQIALANEMSTSVINERTDKHLYVESTLLECSFFEL